MFSVLNIVTCSWAYLSQKPFTGHSLMPLFERVGFFFAFFTILCFQDLFNDTFSFYSLNFSM